MAFFESVLTYTYDENKGLKHAFCLTVLILLFTEFFGGYWSALLKWWWMGFFVLWIFWQNLKFLTYDNIGAKYKEEHAPARYFFALVPTLVSLAAFSLGYFAGPRGWWWLCLPFGFLYNWFFKFIQKARGE